MKMRLVRLNAHTTGMTIGEVYEVSVHGDIVTVVDDDGDSRTRSLNEFEPVTAEVGNRFNASVDGKPQQGQWWQIGVNLVYIVGFTTQNRIVCEYRSGMICGEVFGTHWHHEPACTGWDWVPEGKKNVSPDVVNDLAVSVRKEHKADVAESPDDWVTQDRVPARKGVDEYRYIWRSGNASKWESYDWLGVKHHVHGYTDEVGDRMELRCRRKDLPVVEEAEKPKVATVTVYEVVYGDTVAKLDHDTLVGDECLNRFKRRFKYVSVVSTKTVEVMLDNVSCNAPHST